MADIQPSETPSDGEEPRAEEMDGMSDATSTGASGTSDQEREPSPGLQEIMANGNGLACNETPLDPDHVEERIRVDRRKLEQMLQVGGNEDGETGEAFFASVMAKTQTHITWPSKLKIGAKSKKDPHVKIRGLPENVLHAKQLVMATLDTKTNRVTLKMDVAHTEHSHVIGKGGQNIKRVMADTNCHIHFPDCNTAERRPPTEKSNQVSIAGQPQGVELARQQIRQLLPLTLVFDLPLSAPAALPPDATSPAIQALAQRYGVQISFRSRPRMLLSTCVVRGVQVHASAVMEATRAVVEHLVGSPRGVTINMTLDIAPQHHLFMIGRNGLNVKQIMHRTGASIEFPDSNTPFPQRRSAVLVTGSIESVCAARQLLLGCLPLVLMFDIKDDQSAITDSALLSQIMEALDVFISIKPKPKQPSRSVIVKSVERNAANMYLARLCLLGQEPLPTPRRSTFLPPGAVPSGRRGSLDSAFAVMSGTWSSSSNTYTSAFSIPSLVERTASISLKSSLLPTSTVDHASERQDPILSNTLGPPPGIHSPSVRTRSTPGTWPSSQSPFSLFNQTSTSSQSLTSDTPPSTSGLILHTSIAGRREDLFRPPGSLSSTSQSVRPHGTATSSTMMEARDHVDRLTKDYNFKRQQAQQAVERGRVSAPGIRTPTDAWSGCGFSKSMPDSAMRDHMALRRISGGYSPMRDYQSTWTPVSQFANLPSTSSSSGFELGFDLAGLNDGGSHLRDVDNLSELLTRLGLSKYAGLFDEQEVDLATFLTLNEADLKDLGVSTFGARRRMTIAMEEMQRSASNQQLHKLDSSPSSGVADMATSLSTDLNSSTGRTNNIFCDLRNQPSRSAGGSFRPLNFSRSGQW